MHYLVSVVMSNICNLAVENGIVCSGGSKLGNIINYH